MTSTICQTDKIYYQKSSLKLIIRIIFSSNKNTDRKKNYIHNKIKHSSPRLDLKYKCIQYIIIIINTLKCSVTDGYTGAMNAYHIINNCTVIYYNNHVKSNGAVFWISNKLLF